MHPRLLHALERHHRARQFAFQAALEAHVLDELAGAQRLFLVEQFVAGRLRDLHALGVEQQTRPRQLILAHQNLAALRMDAVLQRLAVEYLHHLGSGKRLAGAVQRAERAVVAPEIEGHGHRQRGGDHRHARQRHTRIELQPAFGQPGFEFLQHVLALWADQSGIRMTSSNAVVSLLRTCSSAENDTLAFWLSIIAPTRSSLLPLSTAATAALA